MRRYEMTDDAKLLAEPYAGLIAALRNQEQCDEDGVVVKVSRQACDEAATLIREQSDRIAALERQLAEARPIPREATEAMMQAAYEDWNNNNGAGKSRSATEGIHARWRAMYDAALAQPEGEKK